MYIQYVGWMEYDLLELTTCQGVATALSSVRELLNYLRLLSVLLMLPDGPSLLSTVVHTPTCDADGSCCPAQCRPLPCQSLPTARVPPAAIRRDRVTGASPGFVVSRSEALFIQHSFSPQPPPRLPSGFLDYLESRGSAFPFLPAFSPPFSAFFTSPTCQLTKSPT